MDRKSIVQQLLPTMIQYKKQLDTRDWAQLSPTAQRLLLLILRKAIDSGENRFVLPLVDVKRELSMLNKEPEYWKKQAEIISKHIVRSSTVNVEIPTFIGCMTLIREVGYDPSRRAFVVDLKPEFVEFLRDYGEGFTQFPTVPRSIRKKYAMNLFRLFSQKNGHFEMDFKEFRKAMGYPDSTKNNNVCLSVEKAINELEMKNIYHHIVFEKTFSPRQGRALISVRFSYEAGQGTLPNLNKAASSTQAAAPDPFPAGDDPRAPRDMTQQPTAEEVEAALAEIQPIQQVQPVEKQESVPMCPRCGKSMVVRTNRNGEKFWGCSDFPKCRGSLDYEEEE